MEKLKIGEICSINPRQNDNIPENSEISFIPMAAVSTNGQVDLSDMLESSKVKNYTVFRNGDVLFAKITPCMENGKGAIVHNLVNGYGAGSTEFIVLRPNADMITAKWLYLYLSQRSFRWECQQHMTGSAGQKRVPPKYLASCEIPVPPVPEQERIVSKIEELFSELDASVAELQTAKEKLKVYRQAVLKEAFRNIRKKVFLKSLFCGTPQNGVYKPKSAYGKGTRILRIDGFYDGFVTSEYEYKRLSLSQEEIEKYSLNQFDLVINRVNSMPYLGKCALIRHIPETTVFESNIMRVRLNFDVISPEYITYFLASDEGRRELIKNAKQAVNQASINQTDVGNVLVPIPGDIALQEQTVSVIERYLSVCDSIEQAIDTSLQQAVALRQSILKQAFEGRLV